jgi:hypothetical protein
MTLPDICGTTASLSRASRSSDLDRVLSVNIAEAPHTWSHFPFTGAPYRAYLFRVGRRTQYWIVYTVDDDARTIDVLHFWNAIRDPERFEVD